MSSIADITYYLEPYLPKPTPLEALDTLVSALNNAKQALTAAEVVLAREEAEPKPTRGQPTLREIAAMLPPLQPTLVPRPEDEVRREARAQVASWLEFNGYREAGRAICNREWD